MTKLFPIVLIVLDLGASVVYLVSGEPAKSLYWIAAALITFS